MKSSQVLRAALDFMTLHRLRHGLHNQCHFRFVAQEVPIRESREGIIAVGVQLQVDQDPGTSRTHSICGPGHSCRDCAKRERQDWVVLTESVLEVSWPKPSVPHAAPVKQPKTTQLHVGGCPAPLERGHGAGRGRR
jgi:hypothetical protein